MNCYPHSSSEVKGAAARLDTHSIVIQGQPGVCVCLGGGREGGLVLRQEVGACSIMEVGQEDALLTQKMSRMYTTLS